jgi:hypothetical protein
MLPQDLIFLVNTIQLESDPILLPIHGTRLAYESGVGTQRSFGKNKKLKVTERDLKSASACFSIETQIRFRS